MVEYNAFVSIAMMKNKENHSEDIEQ